MQFYKSSFHTASAFGWLLYTIYFQKTPTLAKRYIIVITLPAEKRGARGINEQSCTKGKIVMLGYQLSLLSQ